jgi:two-component system chemotaxis response regulator CheB
MKLLDSMPANCPPVVVVQHISAYFARPLALRLAQQSKLKLGVCTEGSPLLPGHIYVADDDRHIGIVGKRGKYVVLRSDGPPINRHRPSVDFLFKSAAVIPDVRASAILLTGMGADGAEGLKELAVKGCMTYAQDEGSCVVFGMPKEAIALGAAAVVGNPYEIRQHLEWSMTQPAEGGQKEPSKLSRLSAGRASLLQP